MRRVVSYVLFALGLFLIFLGPLLRWYALPRVEKAPVDVFTTIVSTGTGSYFNTSPTVLKVVGPTRLENTKVVRGDPDASSDSVGVYDYSATTKDLEDGGAIINSNVERIAIDRVSGVAVHCCGETPRHQGLVIKFPFDTQKKTYLLWDTTQDTLPQLTRAYPAVFSGTDVVDGLDVYVFKQHVPLTALGTLEVSGEAAGVPDQPTATGTFMYTADTTVWVEPVTGAIVKGHQDAVRTLVGPTGKSIFVAAETSLGYTPETVQDQVNTAKKGKDQLRLVSFTIPAFGPIIGIILVVIGLIMMSGAPRKSKGAPKPGGDKTPQPAGVA